VADLRSTAGGEVKDHTAILAQAGKQARQRAIERGKKTVASAKLGKVGDVDVDVRTGVWQVMER